MSNKKYKTAENEPTFVREPVAVYGATAIGSAFSNQWNPNVPLYDTQEDEEELLALAKERRNNANREFVEVDELINYLRK